MVMQTVRSRSHNTYVLPYTVTDLKKVESPLCIKIESPSLRTRRMFDRAFSNELSVSASDLSQRTRVNNTRIWHQHENTSFSTAHWLMVLAIFAATLYLGSKFTNEALIHKVMDLENARDSLMVTQASLNAQLKRAQKRQDEEMRIAQQSISASDSSRLEERVTTLMNDAQRLENTITQERQATFQVNQELDLQEERTRGVEAASDRKMNDLMLSIQGMARFQATGDFGPGPHYAQFTLNIPGDGIKKFIVEFASLELMPVTVNSFLQQIKRGLWDDSAFYLKAAHVLIARPISWDLKRGKREEFGDLERIAFPEYSEHFPHAQYTLGLNGRPSGPDFYINSMDNSVPHGPSGHQKDGYAEPCFAKVIIGKETVDLIAELPNKHDDEFLLQHAIQIVHVKLIKDLQNMAGGPEYLAIQA